MSIKDVLADHISWGASGGASAPPLRFSGTIFFTFPNMSRFRIKNVPKKKLGQTQVLGTFVIFL